MDVHARSQQHVAAFLDHLTAVGLVEALYQGGVPGAGQAGAAGQQGAVVLQPDAGGAVCGGDGRDALFPQAFQDAAHNSSIALGAQGAVHDEITVGQSFQLLGAQLGHKILHGGQAGFHILELDAPVPGVGDFRGQVVQDPLLQRALCLGHRFPGLCAVPVHQPVKLDHRSTDFLQLGDHSQLGQVDAACLLSRAHIGAHKDAVITGFQHPGVFVTGGAGVVKAGHGGHGEGDGQGLGLSGMKELCFLKGAQHPAGLAQTALRRAGVHLSHLFAVTGAGVLHRDLHTDGIAQGFHLDILQGKGGVGQAEAEGELHRVLLEGLKVAVSHIDILSVLVVFLTQEVLAGVVLIAESHSVAELAGGSDLSGEQVRHSVAALHATLPDEQRTADGVVAQPAQIQDAAGVDEHSGLLKGRAHLGQELFLVLGEVIAAGFQVVFPSLASRPANDHQSGLAAGCSGFHLIVCQGHLVKVPGPVTPESHVRGIGSTPLGIGVQKGLVQGYACVFQALHQVDRVRWVHVAPRAVPHVKPIQLDPPEDGHSGPLLQGEDISLVL